MVRILQVPLGEGEAQISALDPDYQVNNDSHNYFELGFDRDGYIHLTGDMHGSPWKYWRSEKPGDITRLVPVLETTYPKPGDMSVINVATTITRPEKT